MRYISDCWFCGLSLNPEYIIQGELHVRKNGRILNKKILNALLAGAMLSSVTIIQLGLTAEVRLLNGKIVISATAAADLM